MEYIKWKDELSVDTPLIDNQHKELFKSINDFYNGISSNLNKEAMLKIIGEMEKYALTHFRAEEALMLKANYKGYQEHQAEHKLFIDKVTDLKKRFNDGRLVLSLEVTQFIREWITNHIKKTDQQYKGIIA